MLVLLAACADSPTDPDPTPNPNPNPTPTPDPVGSVRVTTATDGDPLALDNSYTATVGTTSQAVGGNASVTLTDIPVGSATVTLGDIDARCTPTPGSASVTVTVAENATVDADFAVECLAADGEARWTAPLGGEARGTAIAPDGTAYAVSVGSIAQLVALNPDGTEQWRFDADESIGGAPSIGADGTVYFGTGLGTVYAVNPDGTEQWTYAAGGVFGVASSPAIAGDGTLYVPLDNFLDPPALTALNADGTLAWSYSTGTGVGAFTGPSVGADGTVYVGRDDETSGALIALNPDGTEKWTYATAGRPGDVAEASDGTIYAGGFGFSDGMGGFDIDGTVYAVNPDGTEKWTFPTGGLIESSPALALDGTVYIVSGSDDPGADPNIGDLWAINPDGTQQWSLSLQGCVLDGPTVGADGTVYVPVTGCVFGGVGILNAISPAGSTMWTYAVPGATKTLRGAVTIASDGTAYLASEIEGELVAVKTAASGVAASAWPMQGRDNRNSKSAAGS